MHNKKHIFGFNTVNYIFYIVFNAVIQIHNPKGRLVI